MSARATHPTGGRLSPTLPAESRAPRTVRANRVLLALIGLVLLLVGAGTVVLGTGLFGTDRADAPLLSPSVRAMPQRDGWFWPVVAVGSLIVALLALRWLYAQLRSDRLNRVELEPDPANGHTRLSTGALVDALTGEVAGYRGVREATAHLSGSSADPRLTVRVSLDGRVDPGEVRRRVEEDALVHVRQALGAPTLPTRVEFVLPRTVPAEPR